MKYQHILGHLAFWILIMSMYALSEWGYRDNLIQAINFELLHLPSRVVAVYVNWFYLLPVFLFRNRIIRYLLLLVGLLTVLATAQRLLNIYWGYPVLFPEWYVGQKLEPFVLFRIVQNIVIIASPVAFSTGIKLFMNWYSEKNRTSELEIEKKAAELKYLKGQINPHFLFNILNNIYGLAKEKSDKVPDLILKLSDFLSFSIYESGKDQIYIQQELKLIQDFMDLEKDRYDKRVEVNMSIDRRLMDLPIAPMTFTTLVENAFKHGVREETELATIDIFLKSTDNAMHFEVCNTVPEDPPHSRTSGIGILNLRRRLDLTYPDQYKLNCGLRDGRYHATLIIEQDLYE